MMFEVLSKKPPRIIQLLDDDIHIPGINIFIPTPRFFLFNGSSIPKIFRWLIGNPTDEEYIKPARNHDFLFLTQAVPFKIANERFYSDLLKEGVPRWKAWLKYQAVSSSVGWYFYKNPDKEMLRKLEEVLHQRPDCGFYESFIKTKEYRRLNNA